MKKVIWKDGSQTIRKTHTRDYKYAWSFIDENCQRITGFSETMKNAKNAVLYATKRGHKKPRAYSPYYENYVKSGKKQKDDERTEKLRKTIEIVQVIDI